MSTATDRIEAYLDQRLNHQRGLDNEVLHSMNGVDLTTADLLDVVAAARRAPELESYYLVDDEGTEWAYAWGSGWVCALPDFNEDISDHVAHAGPDLHYKQIRDVEIIIAQRGVSA
jgi:hypothetical protein